MYEYKCTIRRIVDGDTIDVDIDLGFDVILSKQRIRMYGIDTPESRTRDLEEKKFGNLSKEFLKKVIPEGSVQILRTRKDAVGKFGRILGEFPIEYEYEKVNVKTTVNEQMIQRNLAVKYHGQSKESIEEEHLRNREILKGRKLSYGDLWT